MGLPTLLICRSCQRKGADTDAWSGEALYQAVKALRKERHLREVFELEGVDCLRLCDTPCNLQLEGKKRATVTRSRVNALVEPARVVEAACAFARLEPGQELPERTLPGVIAD